MRRFGGHRARLGPLATVLVASFFATAGQSTTPPLTNEDVVRLLNAGTAVESVLERIRSSPPAFDLTPEIVEELRQAHVPEEVLRAMRDRQASTPSPPPPGGTAEDERGPRIRVAMAIERERAERHGGPADRLEMPDRLDPATAAMLGIENAKERPAVDDVAVFLACLTSEHVPDGWKFSSPLGRDFPRMPRHEMLAFVSEATLEGPTVRAGEAPRTVVLVLPASLAADVAPHVAHDWYFGIAVLAGGRWRVIASAAARVDGTAEPSTVLVGTIRTSKRAPFAPELTLKAAGKRSSTPPPPPS